MNQRIKNVLKYQSTHSLLNCPKDEFNIRPLDMNGKSAFNVLKAYLEDDNDTYISELVDAFLWHNTPQGYEYWLIRHDKMSLFTVVDYLQIRYWLNKLEGVI